MNQATRWKLAMTSRDFRKMGRLHSASSYFARVQMPREPQLTGHAEAGLLTSPPSASAPSRWWCRQVGLFATSGMCAARCVGGSYSSGYCPGVTPGSLLIPHHSWPGNLNTFNSWLQRYNFFLKRQEKTIDLSQQQKRKTISTIVTNARLFRR